MSKLTNAIAVLRYVGPRAVAHWALHRLQLKAGWFRRRLPARPWNDIQLAEALAPGVPAEPPAYLEYRRDRFGRFFFPPGQPPPDRLNDQLCQADRDRIIRVADDYARGRFLYFSRLVGDLGQPINWRLNPFNGAVAEPPRHWSEAGNFVPRLGDVKFFWEPSRFGCAFWLVRAFRLTGDQKYAASFWELVESWAAGNPPQMGVNWQSGQETALRAMAWCFGLYAFMDSPAATPDRLSLMARMLSQHARRIEAFIGHAIRQKTNHSLSEATGLLTIGLLFPELKRSSQWVRLGRRVLVNELARQIYDDGGYVQHSMNYHRLMLSLCCWAMRLGQLNGCDLGPEFAGRVRRAGEFLFQMTDPISGRAPNYGGNDGALALPLDSCDYLDHRPAVQLALALTTGRRVFSDGPWNEPLAWLLGRDSLAPDKLSARQPVTSSFDASGYYTLRADRSWCMVRCHGYRDRVAHVDPLHVDLWYAGHNVLRDGGSYLYYAPGEPAMERYFTSVEAHNTIQLDGQEPLRQVSRFLSVPWPKARVIGEGRGTRDEGRGKDSPLPLSWEGEHYAYRRPPWRCVHRRRIECDAKGDWRISDTISGPGRHLVLLRWRLADWDWQLDAQAGRLLARTPDGPIALRIGCDRPMDMRLVRGQVEPRPAGWESLYYGVRSPAPVVEAAVRGELPVRIVTDLELAGVAT